MPRWLGYLCWGMPLVAVPYGIFLGFGSLPGLAPLLACPLMAVIMGLMMRGERGERAGAGGASAPQATAAGIEQTARSERVT